MEYREIKGDLIAAFLQKEVDVIAHQVNCFGIAKSGIAVKIFDAIPWLAEAYFSDERTPVDRLEKMNAVYENGQWGFNLYGQFHHDHDNPEYKTQYPALWKALHAMAEILSEERSTLKIGFPLIGCGLAGGDWSIVSMAIKEVFNNTPFEIIVYRFEG